MVTAIGVLDDWELCLSQLTTMTVQYEGSCTTGVNNILNAANNVVSIAVRLYAIDEFQSGTKMPRC